MVTKAIATAAMAFLFSLDQDSTAVSLSFITRQSELWSRFFHSQCVWGIASIAKAAALFYFSGIILKIDR